MIGQPWVPLFAAESPVMLLLARLVWHPEDVPAAASLVDETKLLGEPKYWARTLFDLLTAEDREEDLLVFRERIQRTNADMARVLDHAIAVSHRLYDTVTIGELADEIASPTPWWEPYRELGERYPALARWRDLVLSKQRGRRRPLEVAAAWEFTALESERSGRAREAARARRAAKGAVLRRKSA